MVRFAALLVVTFALFAAPVSVDAQGRARGLGRSGGASPLSRTYQEPAYARGYADGFTHAEDDRKARKGYDPVAHRDYREADQGFYRSYGSRDAYKTNYRAGFRAGYDAGYRDGSGRRR